MLVLSFILMLFCASALCQLSPSVVCCYYNSPKSYRNPTVTQDLFQHLDDRVLQALSALQTLSKQQAPHNSATTLLEGEFSHLYNFGDH